MYNHGHICEVKIPGRRGAGSSGEKHQEEEATEILEGDRELGMFGQLENGWEELGLFSMNLLMGVGKGAGEEKRTAGREKSCFNWRTMLA